MTRCDFVADQKKEGAQDAYCQAVPNFPAPHSLMADLVYFLMPPNSMHGGPKETPYIMTFPTSRLLAIL